MGHRRGEARYEAVSTRKGTPCYCTNRKCQDQRIAQLAISTEIAWEQVESSNEFKYG